MSDTQTPRRRPDGSIDTAFYIAAGHKQRAIAARDLVGQAPRGARRGLVAVIAGILLLPMSIGQG